MRGTAPGYIRCDNGPELTANALRDWCRFSGTGSSYIEPGAPWENPYVEPFNGRLRDEFLGVEQFDSLLEAQVLIEDWRIEYNTKRPHSSLGWLAPAAYVERWEAQQQRWTLISGGLAKGVRSTVPGAKPWRACARVRREDGLQQPSGMWDRGLPSCRLGDGSALVREHVGEEAAAQWPSAQWSVPRCRIVEFEAPSLARIKHADLLAEPRSRHSDGQLEVRVVGDHDGQFVVVVEPVEQDV